MEYCVILIFLMNFGKNIFIHIQGLVYFQKIDGFDVNGKLIDINDYRYISENK